MEKIQGSLSQTKIKTTEVDQICSIHRVKMYQLPDNRIVCMVCAEEKEIAEKVKQKKETSSRELILPKRLSEYSFTSYYAKNDKAQENENLCREYIDKYPDCGDVLMLGNLGTGKTHLAISICKELSKKGYFCKLTKLTKMIRRIRSAWKTPDLSEDDIINEFLQPDLLVIDEVGVQYGSDSEKIIVTEIINDRYEEMKQTIVIGNLSKSEATEVLGSRVIDRLMHNGLFLVFKWESYRSS